jgi:predicted rRNA methylase YqxC with S4 and FtsJ domains
MEKSLVKLLAERQSIVSLSQARWLIALGMVRVNGETVDQVDAQVPEDSEVEIGKKR